MKSFLFNVPYIHVPGKLRIFFLGIWCCFLVNQFEKFSLKSVVRAVFCRAFDMAIDNEVERLQAMCLARRMIQLGSVPGSVVNALVAIAAEGGEERERMSRICVETLCEIRKLPPFSLGSYWMWCFFSVSLNECFLSRKQWSTVRTIPASWRCCVCWWASSWRPTLSHWPRRWWPPLAVSPPDLITAFPLISVILR